jgi:hypothetical protein
VQLLVVLSGVGVDMEVVVVVEEGGRRKEAA